MFNLFKKKKKQAQTDEEPGFVFSEFPEEMFKPDPKKVQPNQEPTNTPPKGWVCGTPEYMLKMSKEMENSKIPDEVMKEVEAELEELFKDAPKGMGFCHIYWHKKKHLLMNRGYEWYSPKDLNPGAIYD